MRRLTVKLLLILLLASAGCREQVSLSPDADDFFYVENGGVTMPVWVRGNTASGAMVLVVHGGPGGDAMSSYTNNAMDPIEAAYGVAYWDQRAGGSSQGGRHQDQVALATFSEDLHHVIQSLRLRYGPGLDLFLYVHSWGGMLSTDYFLRYGNRDSIAGWIFIDGAFDFPMTLARSKAYTEQIAAERIAAGDKVAEWQEILDFVAVREPGRSVEETLALNSRAYQGIELLDTLIADFDLEVRFSLFSSPNNFLSGLVNMAGVLGNEAFLEEVLATSYTDRLAEIDVPTLIAFGKYDLVIPPDLGDTLYRRLGSPDKQLLILPRSGHTPMDNEPELLNPAILAFIEAQR